jgi:hypothetical protein
MVAMTVLTIGIVGVLGAVSGSLRGSTAAEEYVNAVLVAERARGEFAREAELEAGQYSGAVELNGREFDWTATISSDDGTGLYPLHVTVTWREGASSYDLVALLRPHTLLGPPSREEEVPTSGGNGAEEDAEGSQGPNSPEPGASAEPEAAA